MRWMRPSRARSPLMITVTGVIEMPVTRYPLGGGCVGVASTRGTVLLEAPGEASMWRLTAITSTVAQGWVRHDVRSIKPLLLETCTGWFGESIVPTLTWPGSDAEAAMFVSQLTGPSQRTLHGFGI